MWSLTKIQLLDPFDHSCVILPNLGVTLMSYVGHKKQTWTQVLAKGCLIHPAHINSLMQVKRSYAICLVRLNR